MVASLFISNQIKEFILLATWFLLILVYTSKTEMAKYLLIYNGKSCGWRWLVRKPYTVKQTTQKQNTIDPLFDGCHQRTNQYVHWSIRKWDGVLFKKINYIIVF